MVVGWTLNFEMFFCLVFTIGLATKQRALVLLSALIGLMFLRLGFQPTSAVAITYTSPLFLEFLLGCGIAWTVERIQLPLPLSIAFLALGTITIFLGTARAQDFDLYRAITWGVPSTLIVTGAIALEQKIVARRSILLLGVASYFIYLFHSIALVALRSLHMPLSNIGFVLVGCLISAALGIVVFRLIERPLLNLARGRPLWDFARIGNSAASTRVSET